MEKIIITGGSGFIGTNLLQYYQKEGYIVLNIDIKSPEKESLKKFWINIDITNYRSLERAFIEFNPDYIIHLAARTDLGGKQLSDYLTNTYGTQNIIKACNLLPSLKRVIFTSSMLVCRPGFIPKNQTDFFPSTIYGESKVKMEELIRQENISFEWAIVRPTSIWGPSFGVPYRNFFDMIINRKYFHIGKSSCTKTYGYVENVVYQIDLILKSQTSKINNQVFYLGDYEPTNIKIWANEIATELNITIITLPYFIIKVIAIVGDILKIININFPMSTFRLKNMTTNNIINLENTKEIAPNLPFSRIEGIRKTLKWIKTSNENLDYYSDLK